MLQKLVVPVRDVATGGEEGWGVNTPQKIKKLFCLPKTILPSSDYILGLIIFITF